MFEFTSDRLGAQRGGGGGGRYDGLVEQLGGPPTPAVGWAAGVERILLAAAAGDGSDGDGHLGGGVRRDPVVFVALESEAGTRAGFSILRALWRAGVRAQMEQAGRSLKGQLKQASRAGARAVIVVDDAGVRVRDMRAREEEIAADAEHAVELAVALAGGP